MKPRERWIYCQGELARAVLDPHWPNVAYICQCCGRRLGWLVT